MRVSGTWKNTDMDARSVLRVANKPTNDGPVKRDILLSNVQLVDDDAPIIWHGLQRPSDGILRQALLSPEKGVKAEEGGKSPGGVGESPPSSGVVVVGGLLGESPGDHHHHHLTEATHHHHHNHHIDDAHHVATTQQVIVVNGLGDPTSIIIASPSHAQGQVAGERMSSSSCGFHHANGTHAVRPGHRPKKSRNPLRGNPVLNPGFETPPAKKKRHKRRLSLLVSPDKDGLIDPLLLSSEGVGDPSGKSPPGPAEAGGGDVASRVVDSAQSGVPGGRAGVAGLELGASLVEEPPMPMFAASLDRPSTPGSIQIVSADIDFPASIAKSPSKVPMKLIRTQSEGGGHHLPQDRKFHADPHHFLVGRLADDVDMGGVVDDIGQDPMLVDPSATDHHSQGHLTATDSTEYTDHLLSQLSAGVLPTMSSSQVSSVLSALEPNVSLQNGVLNDTAPAVKADVGLKSALRTTQPAVRREAPVPAAPSQPAAPDRLQPPPAPPPQSQPTIFVKIESSGTNISEAIVRRQQHSTKKKAKIKYTPVECKAGQLRWYKCSGCAFACLGRDSAVGHCARVHGAGVPSSPALARNFRQPKLRCIACPNTFYSLQSVKVHMVADHEVLVPEIHEILMTTIEANKVWRAEARLKLDKASSKVPDHDGSTTGRRISPSRDDPCVGVNPDDDEEESFSLFGSVDSFINSAAATNGLAEARTCPEPEVDRVSGPETPGGAEARVPESAAPPASVITPPVVTSNAAEKQTGGGAKPEPPPPPVPPGTTPKANHVKLEKDNVLKCPTFGCSARFMQASNMEYHKNCHIGMRWRCPECGHAAESWHSLSLHLWRQHAVDMELYSCDQCPFKTNSLSKLTNLHKKTHGEERPFLCDNCGKGFKNTKQLRNHKSTHQPKEKSAKRELNCPTCGRTFSDLRMLRHHTDIVHRKLRPFVCAECGHAAASRSSLRMHSRVHTGEKPYHCSDCDYTTNDHNSLRRHKMRHTGAKHYTCPHCPYACIQSTTYMSHLKNKHPGLDKGLMFTCPVCPFKTIKKEIFLTHASSHKEERRGCAEGDDVPVSNGNRPLTTEQVDSPKRQEKIERPRRGEGSLPSDAIVLTVTPDHEFSLEVNTNRFSNCDDNLIDSNRLK